MKSPYAFVSDEIWSSAAAVAAEEDFTYPIAEDSEARAVSQNDLRRAPVLPLPEATRVVSAKGAPERMLGEARGPLRIRGVIWPVVENRLAVLVFLHGRGERFYPPIEDGTLDNCLTDATAEENNQSHAEASSDWMDVLDRIRRRKHSGEGIALFQCSVSGRLFGTYALA